MILYHGSNIEVREPKLLKHSGNWISEKGFYTTSDFQQASNWAYRTAKRRGTDSPFVTVYKIDDKAFDTLRVLRFESANIEWLQYVAANRKGIATADEYDVVSGPVANDQTMPTITLYLDGFYDEEETIKRLLPQNLKDQHTFKTAEALSMLHCTEVIVL